MSDEKLDLARKLYHAQSRLRQFARLAIGRLTGTTTTLDARYRQHLDYEESRLFHRMELNAIGGILIRKGIITGEELQLAFLEESEHLETKLREKWPEITDIAEDGSSYGLDIQKMRDRCRREGWPP